jgi:Major Facilitator Superfamily
MTTTEPAPRLDPRRWLVLALLAVAQFVVVLDASIMNIALPSIGADLDVSQEGLSWIINGYVLTFGGFLLLGGRLADLLGRRRVFVAGLVLFAAASLAGGLAQSSSQLIAARAVQGLGGALLAPAALSILTTVFAPGAERNKALGVWGAVAGSGGAAGVLLGGVITDALGWEWEPTRGLRGRRPAPRIDQTRGIGGRRRSDGRLARPLVSRRRLDGTPAARTRSASRARCPEARPARRAGRPWRRRALRALRPCPPVRSGPPSRQRCSRAR